MKAKGVTGRALHAIVDGGLLTGPEAELQKHFGLSGNTIPLCLLESRSGRRADVETRAVTPAPAAGSVQTNQAPIIPEFLPPNLAVEFAGISMPTVMAGEATYSTIGTGANVGAPAEAGEQAETDGTFVAVSLGAVQVASKV